MAILINDVKDHIRELKANCITSQLGCLEDINGSRSNRFKDKDGLSINEKFKLILALKELYNQNSLKHKNLYLQTSHQLEKQSIEWVIDDLILSNANQWSGLLIHFKIQYPHFEKYKI